MSEKIKVYTIDNCPYCTKAKNLLASNQIKYEEIHVDKNDINLVMELQAKSGFRTFPQIFLGEKVIGGFSDLEKIAESNGLANLIQG